MHYLNAQVSSITVWMIVLILGSGTGGQQTHTCFFSTHIWTYKCVSGWTHSSLFSNSAESRGSFLRPKMPECHLQRRVNKQNSRLQTLVILQLNAEWFFLSERGQRSTAKRYWVSKSNQTIFCTSINPSLSSWQRWNNSRWVGGNISRWSIIYGQRNFSRGLLREE